MFGLFLRGLEVQKVVLFKADIFPSDGTLLSEVIQGFIQVTPKQSLMRFSVPQQEIMNCFLAALAFNVIFGINWME